MLFFTPRQALILNEESFQNRDDLLIQEMFEFFNDETLTLKEQKEKIKQLPLIQGDLRYIDWAKITPVESILKNTYFDLFLNSQKKLKSHWDTYLFWENFISNSGQNWSDEKIKQTELYLSNIKKIKPNIEKHAMAFLKKEKLNDENLNNLILNKINNVLSSLTMLEYAIEENKEELFKILLKHGFGVQFLSSYLGESIYDKFNDNFEKIPHKNLKKIYLEQEPHLFLKAFYFERFNLKPTKFNSKKHIKGDFFSIIKSPFYKLENIELIIQSLPEKTDIQKWHERTIGKLIQEMEEAVFVRNIVVIRRKELLDKYIVDFVDGHPDMLNMKISDKKNLREYIYEQQSNYPNAHNKLQQIFSQKEIQHHLKSRAFGQNAKKDRF